MMGSRDQKGSGHAEGLSGHNDSPPGWAPHVDWRFLLPTPTLGHVVIAEPLRPSLLDALREVSTRVAVVGHDGSTSTIVADIQKADVAVACHPTAATIVELTKQLRHGGAIYLEMGRPWSVVRAMATLRQLGYRRVVKHWHWPTFEACREIVPLADDAALRRSLKRRQGRRLSTLKAAACRLLHVVGILPYFMPCVSLVAIGGDGEK